MSAPGTAGSPQVPAASETAAQPSSGLPIPRLLPLPLLQGVAIYWLCLKGFAVVVGEPHADEADYWLWGQHLALSYFDHPGLHAWLQGAMSALLGWNVIAMRGLTVATTALTLYVMALWAQRLHGAGWRYSFWLMVAVLFSSPLLFLYTTMATHDRVLAALVMLAVHCFAWFFSDWAQGRRDRVPVLYLAAALLGLAVLTKYNATLVGLGVVLAILARPALRGLLRTPHLYFAALLSILMQAPTLAWNLGAGLASFRFHLIDRAQVSARGGPSLDNVLPFILESTLLLSPFLVVVLLRLAFAPAGSGFGGQLHGLAKWVLVVATAAFVALSLTRYVLFYWNIVGYAAAAAVGAWFIRSRLLLGAQLLYGLLLNTALVVHFSVFPILQAVGLPQPQSVALFGWAQIAAEIRALEHQHGAEFATAPSWETASKLAFALERPDLPALTAPLDAFDYWGDPQTLIGNDAIIIVEPGDEHDMLYAGRQFQSVIPVGEISTERFGWPVHAYKVYLGRSFQPAP